jgi:hypothetical protein
LSEPENSEALLQATRTRFHRAVNIEMDSARNNLPQNAICSDAKYGLHDQTAILACKFSFQRILKRDDYRA